MEGPLILWNRGDDMHHWVTNLPPMQCYLLCCAFLLLSGTLAAQEAIRVTGTVYDAATDEPLAGVSVFIPGTPNGTVTDSAGRFTLLKIKAKKQYGLEFQYIGYTTVKKTFRKKDTVLKVHLEARAHHLNEVVVTGQESGPALRDKSQKLPDQDTALKKTQEVQGYTLKEVQVTGYPLITCSRVTVCNTVTTITPHPVKSKPQEH